MHNLELPSFFDDDLAVKLLTAEDASLSKSAKLYSFDLETKEGILKLLGLLPVLKDDLITDIAVEIWPGHKEQSANTVKMLRSHIRGYLLDYLYESENAS